MRLLRYSWYGNISNIDGEVAEWSKAHAWKACRRAVVSRVRIPSSPPLKAAPFGAVFNADSVGGRTLSPLGLGFENKLSEAQLNLAVSMWGNAPHNPFLEAS